MATRRERVLESIQDFYQQIYDGLEQKTLENEFGSYILGRVKSGRKQTYNKTQVEIRQFNLEFLDVIESTYPALLKIMKDPKRSIRYEQEIVNVEKAKKVNSDTVKHLSSHTHLIKEIKENGDVVPAKVLSTFAEEELAIYENRFIKSLVKRIEMFLERRYNVMKTSLESFEKEHLNVENDFLMAGQEVHMAIDISVKNSIDQNIEATKAQYERLCYLRDLIQSLKGTDFMRTLSKAKDVFPPIMKTNIILHNPDFKMCYNLWLYLDRTDGINFGVEVREKNYRYTSVLNADMNEIMALAMTAFLRSRDIEGVVPTKLKEVLKEAKPTQNPKISDTPSLAPGDRKLEDYRMNEFLLRETAKYYEANLNGMQRSGSSESESLRVIYRQMLDMLDQIYPRVFDVSDEQLNSMDLYEKLEYSRKKLRVLQMVYKQKQMNIARMGKSQKKLTQEITNLQRRIRLQEARELAKKKRQEEKNRTTDHQKLQEIENEKQRIAKIIREKRNTEEKI